MERDKRLGLKSEKGRELPLLTIGGRELPAPPYETIGLGSGYFAVLDPYLKSGKRDELVAELQALIKAYTAPKASKTVEIKSE